MALPGPGGIAKTRLAIEAAARPSASRDALLADLAPPHASTDALAQAAHRLADVADPAGGAETPTASRSSGGRKLVHCDPESE